MREMRDNFLQEIFLGISDHSAAKSSAKIKWHEVNSSCLAKGEQLTDYSKYPSQTQEFVFSSRREIVRHFMIVQSRTSPRPKPTTMGDVMEVLGARKGTLVWVMDVAVLGQNLILGQKYCIKIICTGRLEFSFKAYKKENPNESLDLVSDTYRREA
jgi:hypothetical protein